MQLRISRVTAIAEPDVAGIERRTVAAPSTGARTDDPTEPGSLAAASVAGATRPRDARGIGVAAGSQGLQPSTAITTTGLFGGVWDRAGGPTRRPDTPMISGFEMALECSLRYRNLD